MTETSPELLAIGRVGRAKGLNGAMRVELYNKSSEILSQVESLYVGPEARSAVCYAIREVWQETRGSFLQLENVSTRSTAQALTGHECFVWREQLPPLKEGEFYCCDLVGCRVETPTGEHLGTLKKVVPTDSNDVLVVEGEGGEQLFPVLEGVIRVIDLGERRMVVNPPEVVDAF